MFYKRGLGIEIGDSRIKIVYAENGQVKRYISEKIHAESPCDLEIWADFLREILREQGIHCRNAVFVLGYDAAYVKRLNLPLMTIDQLKLNLPYEFRDYIGEQTGLYQFDYAVIDRTESELDLQAAACRKEEFKRFRRLAKRAGLRLVGLVPEVIGFQRIFEYIGSGREQDYVIADFGDSSIRVHFFRRGIYETTKTAEPGCDVPVQIVRAVDFYCYVHPDYKIECIYYCGDDLDCETTAALAEKFDIPVKNMAVYLEYSGNSSRWNVSPQVLGVLIK